MKSKDQQLLEEAYTQVLNENVLAGGIKVLVNSTLKKVASLLKQKAPEVFNELASCRTPEELLKKVFPKGVPQQTVKESFINEGVGDRLTKALKELHDVVDNPAAMSMGIGVIMNVVGMVLSAATMSVGMGFVAIAGLFLAALGAVMADIKTDLPKH